MRYYATYDTEEGCFVVRQFGKRIIISRHWTLAAAENKAFLLNEYKEK